MKVVNSIRRFCGLILALVLTAGTAGAAERIQNLEQNFLHPPASARPWVFWFWLNGNINSNAITADLEAMSRVGIGGVVIMEVDQGVPKGPVEFASPAWVNLFKHVCSEADRLGMQVNMNNDAGWCGSGGPWITPELSMQKVVWSETNLTGPAHFSAPLPQPRIISNFYREIAVFAVPAQPEDSTRLADLSPTITASVMGKDFDPKKLFDGDPDTAITLPRPEPARSQFLQLAFPKPYRARRLVLSLPGLSAHKMCQAALQISDDGQTFQTLQEFAADASAISVNFPEVSSRIYRIEFTKSEWYLEHLTVAELDLNPQFRISDIEPKALFVADKENEKAKKVSHAEGPAIPRKQVVNLASHFRQDGRLEWEVPPGNWTLLRFGHTSTGEDNMPAPETGRGLECDKLSKEAAEAAFNGLMGKLITAVGPLAGKSLVGTHIDSWEVGSQNWTANFSRDFQKRRGYDPLPFLPVMTGRVLDSLEVSERFLWDLRQTVSELIAENYAGQFSKLARKHGLHLTMEGYDLNPSDDLTFSGQADEPMAEFWSWPPYAVAYSCMAMASVAHVYGKPIVSAEAFTATDAEKWVGHPFEVKVFGDWAFCHGINRFVLHRYALQPWTHPTRSPGMSMGPWGLHYERTQTWWEQAKVWHDYLTRCQYLLQQGHFVADICYLEPEEAPQKWEAPGKPKERPGYNFDGCPAEVVLSRMSVKDGRIVLPDGMSYRLLVLPESKTMTPQLLTRIKELVKAGATVLGPKPQTSPSLSDFPRCDTVVRELAEDLWGDCDGQSVKEHPYGKGKIVWGKTPSDLLASTGLPPDFAAQTRHAGPVIRYTHRVLEDTDIFFAASKSPEPEDAVCVFRVQNKRPTLWWPDTGRIEQPAVYDEAGGTLRVPIHFDPNGSVFVLFKGTEPIERDRITSVDHAAKPLLTTTLQAQPPETFTTNENVVNNFTMAVWAKPEKEIELPDEATNGINGLHVIRNDALFPPPGHDVYPDPGHAGSGVSIGRNGVCVFEHADGSFAATLTKAAVLTNWTHVTIVYREGQPRLYLDGKFLHEGLKSPFRVHPGIGVPHRRGVAPFRGHLGPFHQYDYALPDSEVANLPGTEPKPIPPADMPTLEMVRQTDGRITARAWAPGSYVANNSLGQSWPFTVATLPKSAPLAGPWRIEFPPNQGAPRQVTLENLISWTDHPDPGVKYFSGTATYTTTFQPAAELVAPDQRLYLDLGRVAVIAQVRMNNQDLGTLWKPPFRVDVTKALQPGANTLEIKVVNLWPNRMIGDEQLPADGERLPKGTLANWPDWLVENKPNPAGRFSFTTWRLWKKDSPLQQSGLLGPVTLRPVKEITLPKL
jgi:hypothetical protein